MLGVLRSRIYKKGP
ncbi:unnamed protein product, partial [Didymodactylos carnosus]